MRRKKKKKTIRQGPAKPHGLYNSWYSNGQLMDQRSYVNGTLHGPNRGWFANGELSHDCYYNNRLIDGERFLWFET